MASERIRAVWDHLNRCDSCRLEFHRLQYAAGSPRELIPDCGLLAQMRSEIHRWEDSAREAGRTGEQAKRRVAAEIAPFLGPQATQGVLEPVTPSSGNLLASIEPVLALFLGGRAASRLVSHVVDAALI